MECRPGKYPDQNDQHSPDKSPRAAENERGLAAKMRKAYSITAKKFRWAMCLRSFLILVSTAIYLIS